MIEARPTAARVRLGDRPELEGRNDWMRANYPGWADPEWAERWYSLRHLAPA